VYLNPALIGEEEFMMVNFAHRSQWSSLEFPYTTSQLTFVVPYYKDKHRKPTGHIGGFGVSFYNDMAGESNNLKTTGGYANFAYNLQLSKNNLNRIVFGMQAGFINKRIDKSRLEWGEQYNPFIGFDNTVTPAELDQLQNRTFFDLTAGVFWRYYDLEETKVIRSVYAGFVGAHLNMPDESVVDGLSTNLPVLYKIHGGIVFALSEKTSISANMLSMVQDLENQTNFGSFLTYKFPVENAGKLNNFAARIGAWHRLNDAAIASMEFLTDNFLMGFSYDWNVTSLRYQNRGTGSYEITLTYRFFKPSAPKVMY
jgi:type IX secretion system PorP/SprF family membrane protein